MASGSWIVTQPYHPTPGFREIELAFEAVGRACVVYLRLHEDGRLEVGEKCSEFRVTYSREVPRE